ncbi:nitroreductase [Fischerella thermalis CCMEE 5282]|uniref:nitroreductase family protein n=1 Tax=Fischerella thermalis TaxID=372787 RepID=UPI000C8107D2|nr:nitroreductase family protein [Fischerella thermalis]PMB12960.1 nitroreductase [Fischerella thermalis CCMEE 5328]PMB14240.1 nitroreductase [Fischerella thermalis CCMEE 5282]
MQKLAKTQYPIHNLLQSRWSPLAFSQQVVEPEKLLSVLEAARWTASSFNEQPWSFIITTKKNPTEFDHLLGCLTETNQQWAQDAPVLMLSVAKLRFDRNGKENRHAFHDVGAAVANLVIQATAVGLFVHQMAGFDVEKAREVFGIPDDYEPVTAIAIGYLGDPQKLPENLLQRELAPRTRKPLEKFVFTGNWGQFFDTPIAKR